MVVVASHGRGLFTAQLNVVPINYVWFKGYPQSNNNRLAWKVTNSVGNRGFEVERKYEGESTFSNIGFVPATGASTAEYGFVDQNLNLSKQVAIYRLKQVDFDGATSYTEICPLTNSHKQEIRAYPNPVTGAQFEINLNGRNFNSISISDIAQKQIPVVYTIVSDKIVVNTSEMDAGIYVIKLVLDQKPVILKIAVQK